MNPGYWRPLALLTVLDRRHPLVFLGVLLGGALVLRAPGIATRPLWFDEIWQYKVSDVSSLTEIHSQVLKFDRHPPLCSWLIWLVGQIMGTGEMALRLPSLVLGVASVGLAWAVGRVWAGRSAGIMLALLTLAAPAFVFYSREGRAYAGGLFAVWLFLLALGWFMRRPAWGTTALLTLAACLCLAWQYITAVVVAAGMAVAVYSLWSRGLLGLHNLVRWGLAGLTVAVLLTFLALVYTLPQARLRGTGVQDFGERSFPIGDPAAGAAFLTEHVPEMWEYFLQAAPLGPRWTLVGILLAVPALAAAFWAARRRWTQRALLLVGLGGPVLAILLAGLGLHPFGGTRHCLALAPGLFLIVAAGNARLERRLPWAADASMAGLLGLMVYGQVVVLPGKHYHDYPDLSARMERQVEPADMIHVAGGGAEFVLKHYRDASPLLERASWFNDREGGPESRMAEFTRTIDEQLAGGHRIWVIEFPLEKQGVEPAFAGKAQVVATISCRGIQATLWEADR